MNEQEQKVSESVTKSILNMTDEQLGELIDEVLAERAAFKIAPPTKSAGIFPTFRFW